MWTWISIFFYLDPTLGTSSGKNTVSSLLPSLWVEGLDRTTLPACLTHPTPETKHTEAQILGRRMNHAVDPALVKVEIWRPATKTARL